MHPQRGGVVVVHAGPHLRHAAFPELLEHEPGEGPADSAALVATIYEAPVRRMGMIAVPPAHHREAHEPRLLPPRAPVEIASLVAAERAGGLRVQRERVEPAGHPWRVVLRE